MILCEELFVSNYKTETRSRWGTTDAYREHEQKTKNYPKEKWADANEGMMAIFAEFAACMQTFGQVSGFDNKDFFHFVLLLLRNRTHFYIKFMMQFFLELTFLVFFLLEIKYFVSLQMVHRI